MLNFGFLLFSMVNIFKTPREAMYLWFFIVDFFVLGNIETGILVDFILIMMFWPKLAAIMDFEVFFDM